MSIVFFEDKFCPFEEAKISIMTHAFMYGTAVFEGIRGYWNEDRKKLYIFRPLEHFERLAHSAKILRIKPQYTPQQMLDLSLELLRQNKYTQDVYLRPSLYKSSLKIGPSLLNNEDQFYMFSIPMGDYLDTDKGISVNVSSWRRVSDNALPARAKIVGSYVNTALAKTQAQLDGFDDTVVLTEDGHISEGSAMNIFLLRDGQLITTPTTDDILEGITRSTIIQIAQEKLNLAVVERKVDRTELYTADEVFFCGTGAQISPITSIDHYQVGNGGGEIGDVTEKLQKLYFQIVRGEESSYRKWCIEVNY